MTRAFNWFRRKRTTFHNHQQASEYQQVAGLLCMDIDVLVDCCESDGMTAEKMLWHIRDLKQKKDEMISNKKARESRYAAAAFLVACTQSGMVRTDEIAANHA